MKRQIRIADIQAALDGLVESGLVREFLPTSSEAPVARRRRRFGKKERALIKKIIEEFCPRFASGATVVYVGDAESKFLHLEAAYLAGLGVVMVYLLLLG